MRGYGKGGLDDLHPDCDRFEHGHYIRIVMPENKKKKIEIYEIIQDINSPLIGGGSIENVAGDKIIIMEPEEVWVANPSDNGEYLQPTYSSMFVRINKKIFSRIG